MNMFTNMFPAFIMLLTAFAIVGSMAFLGYILVSWICKLGKDGLPWLSQRKGIFDNEEMSPRPDMRPGSQGRPSHYEKDPCAECVHSKNKKKMTECWYRYK